MSVDGQGSGVKKVLSRIKIHLVCRRQFVHPRALPECLRPSAVIRGDLQSSTLKRWGMSVRSVRRILLSDLNLHPHKFQAVHSLSGKNKEVSLQFCRLFQGILLKNPDLPKNLLMRDEAHFHLNDTVNKQKFRYSSAVNPHELHQRPLYVPEVTVWRWPLVPKLAGSNPAKAVEFFRAKKSSARLPSEGK